MIDWVLLGSVYQQYVDVASLATSAPQLVAGDKNQYSLMLECILKAIEIDPSCADAYSLMATYYLENKAFGQAYSMAEKSIPLHLTKPATLNEFWNSISAP